MSNYFPVNYEFTYKGYDAWIAERRGDSYIVYYNNSTKATVLSHDEVLNAVGQ